MVRCSIHGCPNYQGRKDDEKAIRFFGFPKDSRLCKEWIRACGKKHIQNLTIARVCSEHFGENDWKLQDILLNTPLHKRKLKEGAIPSMNVPRKQYLTKHDERILKKQRKELVEEAVTNYNKKYVMEISCHFKEPEVDHPRLFAKPGQSMNSVVEDPLGGPCPEADEVAKQNRVLRIYIKKLAKRLQQAENAISSVGQIFSQSQVKRLRNPDRKYKWSYEDISQAASLYSAGPAAYAQLVKQKYPFPTPTALRKWTETLKISPGMLTNVMQILASHEYDEIDRLCILSFHEFKLKALAHDEASSNGHPYKSAQAVIVRGLVKDWKRIIYYNFNCHQTIGIIQSVVKSLKEINFTVVAIVSGVGRMKLPMWPEMTIDKDHPYTEFYLDEKVFFFGNIPHLIKCFRNCFVETDLVIDGVVVNLDPVRELLQLGVTEEELGFKLTEAHISARKVTLQNHQLGWELFSHPVANTLRKYVSMGKIYSPNAIECIDLIEMFSNWLDVFNAKRMSDDETDGSLAYGLNLEDQNSYITLMDSFLCGIQRYKSKTLLPFQKGILLNNTSLKLLLDYLGEKYNLWYVITNRLNQDDLEKEFRIRRPNDSLSGLPTALEFKHRISLSILNNLKS